ncbi:MAG TPA: phosphoglycolate/pyridoxal phosphate family phosphatase [Armatimonadota bacterium]|jgi:phosphoglycolate/pyridoxal phosphate phosphatase family enzyme
MLFVFDLDGVIYRGTEVLPCAPEVVHRLRSTGHQAYFLTNNSARTRASYVDKLRGMGVECTGEEVMTSSYATALYLQEQGVRSARILPIGEEGVRIEMQQAGHQCVEPTEDCRADYVVVGIDRQITYLKIKAAQQAILHGAGFIATNRDNTYPLEGGRVEPGAGAIVAAIQACSGVEPVLVGKPVPYSLEKVLALAGVTPEETVMVGDRLDTDIAIGKRVGVRTALVLTGVTSAEQAHGLPEDQAPDYVLRDLSELLPAVGLH